MAQISMVDVVKEFRIKQRSTGSLRGAKDFFHPQYTVKRAVDGVSLEVEQGEIVGYIGPNGAGKSTTLKMLTGILTPTSGRIEVSGAAPSQNRRKNALHMGAVFGHRSQLLWDLPVRDTFELHQQLYHIPQEVFERNRAFYIELLDMGGFTDQATRQLSLGQKMRANIALALLHDPDILYLDEPTIGLDVVAKNRIRQFILEVNKARRTTIMLTTHDMSDIESVCQRVVLIDSGKKLYDGTMAQFKRQYAQRFQLRVVFREADAALSDPRFEPVKREGNEALYAVRHADLQPGEALLTAARGADLMDISILEPTMEEIVRVIYEKNRA